jgi:phage/plasmid-like protein (TIGR03299 family)
VTPPKRIFRFFDELVDSGEAKFHTAGVLKGGSVVWVLMKRPDDILIGGHPEERMQRFIFATTGYDTWGQSLALTIAPTDVRVVCWNTVQMALSGMLSSWSIPHTGDLDGKIEEVRKSLDLRFKHDEQFEALANRLLEEPFTTRDMRKLLKRLTPFQVPEQDTDRKAENREYAMEAIVQYFTTSPTLTETPAMGTKWGAYNAIIEWSDWDRIVRRDKQAEDQDKAASQARFRKIMFDTGVKEEALALIAG